MYLFRWITLINFIFFQIGHLQINEKSEENGKFVNNKTQKTGFFKEKLFFFWLWTQVLIVILPGTTTANATDSSSAAAKSEAEGKNKTNAEDDDKGVQLIKYTYLWYPYLVNQPDILGCYCLPRLLQHYIFFSEDKAAQSLLNKPIRNNLVNNTNQVEVLQKDPNSPLYSVKSFEELRL